MADSKFDLIVIGAGWAGLIAATTYLRLAPETKLLILDDGKSIGGVWNDEHIYPNLFAQVGHGLFEYSSFPMEKKGLTPDRYISGNTINEYLTAFAEKNGIVSRIRLQTKVKSIKKVGNKATMWRLMVEGEQEYVLETTKVIVASGASSGPYVPDFPRSRFTKPIIHSSQIGRSLSEIGSPAVQRVVILGAAKSAYDTVFLMLKQGKKVDWVIREDGSGPLAIMPPRLFKVFNTIDVMSTRLFACFSPAILQTKGFWYHFLQRSWVGRKFTTLVWRIVTILAERHADYSRNENVGKLRPVPKNFGLFWANSGLGLASVPDFWKTVHAGDVTVHRTSIESLVENTVKLGNGTVLETDYVVFCTGWSHNLSTFESSLKAEIGLPYEAVSGDQWAQLDAQADLKVEGLLPNLTSIPHAIPMEKRPTVSTHQPWRLYRRLVSPAMANAQDRSIYFPGHVHSVFTPLVCELQALWGAAFLLGRLPIPSLEAMQEEVAVWTSWTKKRYLAQGKKHSYAIYDYLTYVDSLANDLGIKTNRKSNILAEMCSPYRPSDYRGLVDEYLAAEMRAGMAGMEDKTLLSTSYYHLSQKLALGFVPLICLLALTTALLG